VLDKSKVYSKGTLSVEIIDTMLVKFKHSFSISDLAILQEKLDELSFYCSVLSSFEIIPRAFESLASTAILDSLYHLSNILDKYSLEETELQKLIMEFERLKSQSQEIIENEKTEYIDCFNGSDSVYAYC
jgi:hypothetical protein